MLAAPVFECYPQVPGQYRPRVLADTVFFQSCVKVRGLRDERREPMKRLMRSALHEMQLTPATTQKGWHPSGFWGLKLKMKSDFEFQCHHSGFLMQKFMLLALSFFPP